MASSIERKNAVMSWTYDAEAGTLTCAFKGGETRTFDLETLSPEIRTMGLVNGMKQRFADAAALPAGTSVADKQAAVWALMDHYASGTTEWSVKREGPVGTRIDVGLVVEALCAVRTSGDVDKANRLIDGLAEKRGIGRDEAAKIWASTSEVAPEYATRLARKRAASAGVGAADLEAELMAE